MTNNDILRRVRYLFDFSDSKMVALFKLADHDVTTTDIIGWLEKEGETLFVDMADKELAIFLNGLIIEKRGKREGPQPKPEESLTNNVILRKFKIALDLKSEDMLELFESVDRKISKHELSAFFRKPGNKSYQLCMNQYLRAFLNALQLKYRKY
jgi:uncharacterized protein YehS (DUF1456 family)